MSSPKSIPDEQGYVFGIAVPESERPNPEDPLT